METGKNQNENLELDANGLLLRLAVISLLTTIITNVFRTKMDTGWFFIVDYISAFGWAVILCLPFMKWFLNVSRK